MGIQRVSVDNFNSEFWEQHYRSSLPFVLELDPDNVPCLGWTIETLGKLANDEEYILYEMPPGKFYTSRSDSIIHKLHMKEICDLLLSSGDSNRYQMVTDIKSNPAFFGQVPITKELFTDIHSKIVQCNLWLNVGDFVSGFHNECFENLNLQISGTKRFVLFEPGVRNYYTKSILSGQGHTSYILDPDDYDEDEFRDFEKVKHRRHEVTLNSGDLLYLPACWWHNVHSEGDTNINVNFWWMNIGKSVTRYPRQLVSGIVTVLHRKFTNQLY